MTSPRIMALLMLSAMRAYHGEANFTCAAGKLGGGDLNRSTLSLTDAMSWCTSHRKCAGFCAQATLCAGNTTSLLDVHFKDAWGVAHADSNPAWTKWRPWHAPSPPPPPAPPAPPRGSLVLSLSQPVPFSIHRSGQWVDGFKPFGDRKHTLGHIPKGPLWWGTADAGRSWAALSGMGGAAFDTEMAILTKDPRRMRNIGNISACCSYNRQQANLTLNHTSVTTATVAVITQLNAGGFAAERESQAVTFAGIPEPGIAGVFRTTGADWQRMPDASLLCSVIVCWAGQQLRGDTRASIIAFTSIDDGFNWKYAGVIANASQVPRSHEGPNENSLAIRPRDGALLCVMRLDGGDAGGWNWYASSVSRDGGSTWSAPVSLPAGVGCARPRLIALGNSLLISGGRPRYNSRDVKLWLNVRGDGGSENATWDEWSVSYWHNRLLPNTSLHFTDAINHSSHWPRETASYTSLWRTAVPGKEGLNTTAVVVYADQSTAFAMPIEVVPNNHNVPMF